MSRGSTIGGELTEERQKIDEADDERPTRLMMMMIGHSFLAPALSSCTAPPSYRGVVVPSFGGLLFSPSASKYE